MSIRIRIRRCNSITDADDVALDFDDDVLDKQKLEKQDSGFHTMSFNSQLREDDGHRVRLQRPLGPPDIRAPSLDCVAEGAVRRQSVADGSKEERVSLLSEDLETDDYKTCTPSASDEGLIHHQESGSARLRILKRELMKIRNELRSLGEVEMEVSYV
jgi:hypothetical protein